MHSLLEILRQDGSHESSQLLLEYAGAVLTDVAESGGMPESRLREMLGAIGESGVPGAKNAWQVVDLLDEHWDVLDDGQRRKVAEQFERAFGSSPNYMFQFRIAEILATRCDPTEVAEWILRIAGTKAGESKACLVHSLDHLLPRLSPAAPSRGRLLSLLTAASSDADEDVRREARNVLSRHGVR